MARALRLEYSVRCHGTYEPVSQKFKVAEIFVWMLTAKRKQVVAFRVKGDVTIWFFNAYGLCVTFVGDGSASLCSVRKVCNGRPY